MPHSARIFGVVVESEVLRKYHNLSIKTESEDALGSTCTGNNSPMDFIVDAVPQQSIKYLSEPFEVRNVVLVLILRDFFSHLVLRNI